MQTKADGFSLPETLIAMLLLSLSLTALLQYQRALTGNIMMQWQQREAWHLAAQRLLGRANVDGRSELEQRAGPEGCVLVIARIITPAGFRVELPSLQCSRQ